MNYSDNNSTYYLVSRQLYEHSKFVIYMICIPVIAICGIVGNSLSLYILQKYPTKHAFVIYLKVLTATDACLLSVSLLQSVFKMCANIKLRNALMYETYALFYAGIIVGSLLQRLSSAFITVIAIERLLAVLFPFRLRRMCIETRPIRILAALACFFIVLQIPTLFVVKVQEASVQNNTIYIISRTNIAFRQPVLTMAYLILITIFGIGLPLFFVLVSACCIVFKMKNRKKNIANNSKVCKGSIETETMSFTLVVLATFFAAMSLPAISIYLWTSIDRSTESTFLRALLVDVNIVLVCMNSASDFIIYCMTSKKFRVLFFESVRCSRKVESQSMSESGHQHGIRTVSGSTECVEISSKSIEVIED